MPLNNVFPIYSVINSVQTLDIIWGYFLGLECWFFIIGFKVNHVLGQVLVANAFFLAFKYSSKNLSEYSIFGQIKLVTKIKKSTSFVKIGYRPKNIITTYAED